METTLLRRRRAMAPVTVRAWGEAGKCTSSTVPNPESVACGSARRPTHSYGSPCLQESVPFYGAEPYRLATYAVANAFRASLRRPIVSASAIARSVSQPSPTTRLMYHIAPTRLADPQWM